MLVCKFSGSSLSSESQFKKVKNIVKDDAALITIVGRGIVEDAVFLGQVFTCLGAAQINISFIAQSPKKLNIIIGVKNEDYVHATKVLYKELIG